MSDPIDNLRRKEQQEFTAILEGAQRKMPVQQAAPAAPPPVAQPMPEAQAPPPPTLQQPIDTTNLFDGLNLEQPVNDLSVPTAGVRPSDVLQTVVQPDVQRDLTTQLTQRAINEGEVASATQAGVMPYLFQPPNTEALRREFGSSISWATRDLERMNIEARARQDANLQAQTEWSRQALEFLKSEEGKKGSTGDPFEWVKDIVGVKENGRTYLQPWNQQRGVSIPAALLYGLGVVQNTAVGAAMDVRGILSDIAKAVPPWAQVDPNKMPGWAQGLLNSADKALSQQVFGANAAVGSLTGMSSPARGMFRGVAEWLTTADRSITDKKSNVIEALRGAQYSFTDDVGSGVGIKVNRGFRVGAAPGKGFGFDVNPSVLAGFGLDVIAGNRADKIIDTGRIIFSPVRGAYRILRGKRPPDDLAQAVPNPTPPPKPSGGGSAVQLELPFLPNSPQAIKTKPKSPAQIEAAVLGSKLPAFKKANQQQAKKIASIRKAQEAAAKKAEQLVLDLDSVTPYEPRQLELSLGSVQKAIDNLPVVNVTAPKPRVRKPVRQVLVDPQQLELNFNAAPDPVRAVRQVLSAIPKTGDAAADAYVRARVVNQLMAEADATVKAADEAIDTTPDVGRKFVGDAPPPPDSLGIKVGELPTTPPPSNNLFHGTRVEGLNLQAADPVEGAARSELGTAHYLSSDPEHSKLASTSITSDNLPVVENRSIGAPSLLTTEVDPAAKLIDATAQSDEITRIANLAGEEFGVSFSKEPMSLVEMFDQASRQLPETEALQFQRSVVKTLRESGYHGSVAGKTVAVYDPAIIKQVGGEALPEVDGVIPKLAARADLEAQAVTDTGSTFSKAASADTELRTASQVSHEASKLADEVAAQSLEAADNAKLWDDLIVDDLGDYDIDKTITTGSANPVTPYESKAASVYDSLSYFINSSTDPTAITSGKLSAAYQLADDAPDLPEVQRFLKSVYDAINADSDYWEFGGTAAEAEELAQAAVKELGDALNSLPLDTYTEAPTIMSLAKQSELMWGQLTNEQWQDLHYFIESSNSGDAIWLKDSLDQLNKNPTPENLKNLVDDFYALKHTFNSKDVPPTVKANSFVSVLNNIREAAKQGIDPDLFDDSTQTMLGELEKFAVSVKTSQTLILNDLLNTFKYQYESNPTNKGFWQSVLGTIKDFWDDNKFMVESFNAEYAVQKEIADNFSVNTRRTIEHLISKYEPSFNPEPAFSDVDELRNFIIQVKNPNQYIIDRLAQFDRNQLAVYAYTDTEAYKYINRYLGSGEEALQYYTETEKTFLKILPDLDVAIRTQPVHTGELYRGQGSLRFVDAIKKYKVGETVTEKPFLSTSIDESVARGFGSGGGTVFVYKDGRGYKLHSAASKFIQDESEVLIPRGTNFVVESIDETTRTITMRQIPNHEFTSYNRISVLYSEIQDLERQFHRNPSLSTAKAMAERQAELDQLIKKSPCGL
ncbi:ParB-like partition nuclease [Phormidium phage Pf-WMP4]|uniref:PfWMP4_32 n=1 Tax=Phormidium phage Pf-WMP4 TaxID=2913979 RepID=Q0GBT4_9CAUD|nr:ParB-like partition nuclease [Phormidium phage Pf-WMP4]ABI33176.1 PfWMP4_32 [Phormidium phage Pf-WMP4]